MVNAQPSERTHVEHQQHPFVAHACRPQNFSGFADTGSNLEFKCGTCTGMVVCIVSFCTRALGYAMRIHTGARGGTQASAPLCMGDGCDLF